jgi:hypothetical protein
LPHYVRNLKKWKVLSTGFQNGGDFQNGCNMNQEHICYLSKKDGSIQNGGMATRNEKN